MFTKHALTVALLSAGMAGVAQATSSDCSPSLNAVCTAPDYAVYVAHTLTNPGTCPVDVLGDPDAPPVYEVACIAAGEPPAPASMDCAPVQNGVHCTASPIGPALSYEWQVGTTWRYPGTTDPVVDPGQDMTDLPPTPPPAAPAASYDVPCGPGLPHSFNLMLQVIGPNGEVAMTARTVFCP